MFACSLLNCSELVIICWPLNNFWPNLLAILSEVTKLPISPLRLPANLRKSCPPVLNFLDKLSNVPPKPAAWPIVNPNSLLSDLLRSSKNLAFFPESFNPLAIFRS